TYSPGAPVFAATLLIFTTTPGSEAPDQYRATAAVIAHSPNTLTSNTFLTSDSDVPRKPPSLPVTPALLTSTVNGPPARTADSTRSPAPAVSATSARTACTRGPRAPTSRAAASASSR